MFAHLTRTFEGKVEGVKSEEGNETICRIVGRFSHEIKVSRFHSIFPVECGRIPPIHYTLKNENKVSSLLPNVVTVDRRKRAAAESRYLYFDFVSIV